MPKNRFTSRSCAVVLRERAARLGSGSSHFMVGLRLKRFTDRHLAVSVGNFRTIYIRKPSFVQALRRY